MATIQLAPDVDSVHISAGSDVKFVLDGPDARVETDNVDLIEALSDDPAVIVTGGPAEPVTEPEAEE